MSMESENIFINELKFDVQKDKVKKFILNNLNTIIIVSISIIVILLATLFINLYHNNKINNYNNKIYSAIISNNKISELEKIYNNKSTPRISKTFTAIKLIEEYNLKNNKEQIINLYTEIFNNEKDIFFKNYAGLNLLIIKIDEKELEINYINNLFNKLEKENNPLYDMVLEQKAIFYLKQNKKDDAKTILNNLLRRNLISKERIEQYLKLLK